VQLDVAISEPGERGLSDVMVSLVEDGEEPRFKHWDVLHWVGGPGSVCIGCDGEAAFRGELDDGTLAEPVCHRCLMGAIVEAARMVAAQRGSECGRGEYRHGEGAAGGQQRGGRGGRGGRQWRARQQRAAAALQRAVCEETPRGTPSGREETEHEGMRHE
jgi:hypothetical protein